MAVLIANVYVQESKKNEFAKIMSEVTERVKKEKGCNQFEMFHHDVEVLSFSFYAIWYSYEDFQKFLISDEFSMMMLAFKLLKKRPEIHFFSDNSGLGLHELLKLRENHNNVNIN